MDNKYYQPCDKHGSMHGDCCCNCIAQLTLRCSASNEIFSGDGLLGAYVCTVEHHLENNYHATIFDHKHGICELHIARPINRND